VSDTHEQGPQGPVAPISAKKIRVRGASDSASDRDRVGSKRKGRRTRTHPRSYPLRFQSRCGHRRLPSSSRYLEPDSIQEKSASKATCHKSREKELEGRRTKAHLVVRFQTLSSISLEVGDVKTVLRDTVDLKRADERRFSFMRERGKQQEEVELERTSVRRVHAQRMASSLK